MDVAAVREALDRQAPPTDPPTRPGRRLVLRALSRHRGRLLAGLGLLCVWQASEAAVPILVGLVIDHAIATPSWPAIAVGLAAVALLFTVLSLAYRFGARLANRALNIETHQLRVEVAEHALNPRGLRTDLMPGEILSIATADADNTAFLFRRIALAGAAAVGVLIGAGYLLITDWVVGLVVLIGLPVTLAIAQLVAPVVGRRMERQQQQIAAASGMATDLMTGLRVIKGIGGAATAAARYRQASQRARAASVRTTGGMALIDGLQQTLVGLLVAGVVIAAGWRVIIGEVSVGELVAMVGLAVFLAEPVGTVVAITAMIAQSLASARRIADFHGTPTVVPDGDRAADPDAPAMELSDFAVDPLPATDLAIQHGELVAAVIADARAAETFVAALAGESDEYSGSIRVGGVPRSELSVAAAHRAILVPPHDVDLFAGTIGSNVRIRAAESDVEPALRAAAVTELIELMPEGLDHRVDAAGSNLSGGQRQRIALARALATAPSLLVLTEPTTAVDAVTEAGIAGAVKRLRAQQATLVVSTSPAFLAVADRVAYLTADDGVRVGRHDDLMTVAGYRAVVAR